MNDKYITVSQLTRYIKFQIDNDKNLNQVFLKGEISNFKAHSRGHFYFTIKDETSRINAIMFNYSASKLKFMPKDGMKILVRGKISVFESTGNYQIYVDDLIEDGLGNLHIAFEQLKEKLSKEGLFDQEHKKKIPKIPERVGVITAPTGAAIKDILSTIKRRYPICDVILFPSLVQGELAKDDIVKNILLADQYNLDVIILGRGGGSIEDLWPFNEEVVARTVYDAKTPIISAVGHEIDFTICDFVADLRAETPTGAAERAVPDLKEIINYLDQLKIRSNSSINNILKELNLKLNKLKENYILKNPINIYQIKEQRLDIALDNLNKIIKNILSINNQKLLKSFSCLRLLNPNNLIELNKKSLNNLIDSSNNSIINIIEKYNIKVDNIIEKLNILNPLNSLKRGYSITKKNNRIIKDISFIKINDNINVKVENGTINAKVVDIIKE